MSDKGRQRNRDANMRGGIGVRARLSEASQKDTYRLNGVATGSAVARCFDKYGRWDLGWTVGVIVRRSSSTVQVRWLGDEDATSYTQGDARYEVDRGRWRILGVLRGDPLSESNDLVAALTKLAQEYRVEASAQSDDTPTEEQDDEMAQSRAAAEREAAKKAAANGDLKDRETYTAKQIATRCGTDSKTMRKFFRTPHSTVEPVGQGGRYEFAATDLPKIKREYEAWAKRAQERSTSRPKEEPIDTTPADKSKLTPKKQAPTREAKASPTHDSDGRPWAKPEVEKGFGGIDRYGPNDPDVLPSFEDAEPTDEELAELDDLELDEVDD